MWGSDSLLLREKLRVKFPPECFLPMARLGLSLSYLLRYGFFFSFALCVGIAQLVLSLFRENCSSFAVDLKCVGEKVSSGSSYVAIFNWNQSLCYSVIT